MCEFAGFFDETELHQNADNSFLSDGDGDQGLAGAAGSNDGLCASKQRNQMRASSRITLKQLMRLALWGRSPGTLSRWLAEWLKMAPCFGDDGRVFLSDKLTTPLLKDNCWRRYFLPRLRTVGLGWANFQVMRRTHSCLLDELGIDPQVRADQMGHTVDVNQNKYTKSSLQRRRAAVNALEQAVGVGGVQEQIGASRGEGQL